MPSGFIKRVISAHFGVNYNGLHNFFLLSQFTSLFLGPGPRTPQSKGAKTPDTPPEDTRLFKPREIKGPSTPPSPPSVTAALEKAMAYRHSKGPRTPPDYSPRGQVSSPPLQHPQISPRSKRRRTPPPPPGIKFLILIFNF